MPFVIVKMGKGRTVEVKRKLARAVTDALVDTLDVKPEWVTVLLEESDKENWATGGVLHSDGPAEGSGKKGTE
jgi:4-oxalocrotonate tautomerase